jgi:hypothetical protein
VKTRTTSERQATAHVMAALMELDARRLYLGQGCSSLFTYCTQVLHFSEHAAYGRIEAARAARRFRVILDLFADGALTLTAVCLLAPHLTPENQAGLLAAARHQSKRAVEHLVVALHPRRPCSSIRKLAAAPPIDAGRAVLLDTSGAHWSETSAPIAESSEAAGVAQATPSGDADTGGRPASPKRPGGGAAGA